MRTSKGMTLIEVMVALAIFATASIAVMQAVSSHATGIKLLEETSFATWVANNRLAEIQLEQVWPPKNNKQGSEEMAGREWFWRQVVVDTTDKEMKAVTIEVRSEQDAKSNITSVTSYVSNSGASKK